MAASPQTRTCTLAFVDLVGSTALWEEHKKLFELVLTAVLRELNEAVAANHGSVVKSLGDGLMVTFESANDAFSASAEMHQRLAGVAWGEFIPGLAPMMVRIGLHTGEVIVTHDAEGRPDYLGPTVNRVARIQAAAHPGQTLASSAAAALATALPPGLSLVRLGSFQLQGAGEEVLFDARTEDSPAFPSPRASRALNESIPESPVQWIGSVDRLERIRTTLREARLVTLTGIGGSGKTSTALAATSLLAADFADGIRWVDCEEVHDLEAHLRRSLAAGLPEDRDLVEALKDAKALLVLDGLASPDHAGEVVGRLLQSCPGLRVLATSRRPIGLARERVIESEPMSIEEGITLFGQRASGLRPGFEIGPDNELDVAEICRTVDGLPLAIELAASLVRGRTPREIGDLLTKGIAALARRAQDVPLRQRSMTSMLETSRSNLSAAAQAAWLELSVFSGTFDRAEALSICPALENEDLALDDLTDEGLLRTSTHKTTQRTNYSFPWCVREFGRARLAEDVNRDHEARARLAFFLIELLEASEAATRTPTEVEALDAIRRREGDLDSAYAWCLERGGNERVWRFAVSFAAFLMRVGASRRALEVVRGALERRHDDALLRSLLLLRRCSAHIDVLDWPLALADVAELEDSILEIESVYERARLQVRADGMHALVLEGMGDIGKSREIQLRSLSRAIDLGDRTAQGVALHNLGKLDLDAGMSGGSTRDYLTQALAVRRDIGDLRGTAETLTNLGLLDMGEDAIEEAAVHLRAALEAEVRLHNQLGIGRSLFNLGEVEERRGNLIRGGKLYRAAEQVFKSQGSPYAVLAAEESVRLSAPEMPDMDIESLIDSFVTR